VTDSCHLQVKLQREDETSGFEKNILEVTRKSRLKAGSLEKL